MISYLCAALVFVAACTAQVHESTPIQDPSNAICKRSNAYYKVDNHCDSYIECTNFVAKEMFCPDGLNYNPDAKWPNYPCGYPTDVPCVGRSNAQPAQPTADCPRQYGYFASPVSTNCGQYRVCVAGKATEMLCATGLAFNPDTSRCDWPDQVPSCKTDQYLGFSCPAARTADVINYKYPGNCYFFYSCQMGHARLLSCDSGLAFDPKLGRCVDKDDVDCEGTPLAADQP